MSVQYGNSYYLGFYFAHKFFKQVKRYIDLKTLPENLRFQFPPRLSSLKLQRSFELWEVIPHHSPTPLLPAHDLVSKDSFRGSGALKWGLVVSRGS